MAAGHVDRTVLSSFYQQPGDIYDDTKTEGAFETLAQQSDDNYDFTAGLISEGTLSRLGIVNVRDYGAEGDDVADDTAEIQAAIDAVYAAGGGTVVVPGGVYKITSLVTVKSNIRFVLDKNATIKRYFNGNMLNLKEQTELFGGVIDGNGGTYSGSLIVIDSGENSSTIANQGHQFIFDTSFRDYESYAVEYTTANKGWLSKIQKCRFDPVSSNTTAIAVKWPNEGLSGGNRAIIDCYSGSPIVDLNGCDNGFIMGNTVGVQAGDTRSSLVFSGSPKKVVITSNRLAHGTNLLTFKGSDHVISSNEIASSVAFDSSCTNVIYDVTNRDQGFSGTIPFATNYIDSKGQEISFTPTWSTSATQPSFGNADVRARYVVDGRTCKVRVYISFGSTSTFGTAVWRFSIPIASLTTSYFTGSAYLGDRAGIFLVKPTDGYGILILPAGGGASSTTPITWTSGSILSFEYEYNLS